MPAALVDAFQRCSFALLLLLVAAAPAARADQLADLHAAVAQVSAECRTALGLLETSGPEETAAAVGRMRESWQRVVQQFGAGRPPGFTDQEDYTTTMLDTDMRLVGALIIIKAGRQDAARQALAGIGEILSRLETASAPRAE